MTRTVEGSFDGRGLRVAVVASRFNETVSRRLAQGAVDALVRHGVDEDAVLVAWVPGSFELPGAARHIASSGEVDAIVCIGAVIRGETPHFDHVANAAATGILRAGLDACIPITFGVLTVDTTEQADARAGGKLGNKGAEAAVAAIETANLFASLPKPTTDM